MGHQILTGTDLIWKKTALTGVILIMVDQILI